MVAAKANNAIVKPVPESYEHCVRTNTEQINVKLAKQSAR
jgi:hypothetical protein